MNQSSSRSLSTLARPPLASMIANSGSLPMNLRSRLTHSAITEIAASSTWAAQTKYQRSVRTSRCIQHTYKPRVFEGSQTSTSGQFRASRFVTPCPLPRAPAQDVTNMALPHAEHSRENLLRDQATQPTDLFDFALPQTPSPRRPTLFREHVIEVVLRSAKEEMIGVHAGRRVTLVQDPFSRGDRAVRQLPGMAVSKLHRHLA